MPAASIWERWSSSFGWENTLLKINDEKNTLLRSPGSFFFSPFFSFFLGGGRDEEIFFFSYFRKRKERASHCPAFCSERPEKIFRRGIIEINNEKYSSVNGSVFFFTPLVLFVLLANLSVVPLLLVNFVFHFIFEFF